MTTLLSPTLIALCLAGFVVTSLEREGPGGPTPR